LLGPLDDQPFLGAEFGAQIVAMSRMDAQARKPPFEPTVRAFAPWDGPPSVGGKAQVRKF
jgi:hypothetical protein